MYGKNPVRKIVPEDEPWSLSVNEMFTSIQGEGPSAGQGAVFVRLQGCNLRCYWCDTEFEKEAYHFTHVDDVVTSIRELAHLHELKAKRVVFTGGEPFRWVLRPIIVELLALGWLVEVETNGTLPTRLGGVALHQDLTIICSPKTVQVDVNMHGAKAWKYIIGDSVHPEDGLPTYSTQQQGQLCHIQRPLNEAPVYVQPMDVLHATLTAQEKGYGVNCQRRLVNNSECMDNAAASAMQHGHILSIQLHKIAGLP